jgi:dTDP-4-amino-4,6-dideoxygalactose transaminase
VADDMDPAWWIYTVLLDDSIDRDEVIQRMKEKNVHTGVVHVPNHPYDCFENGGPLPETDKFARKQICIPCGWWLSSEDVSYIANSLIESCEEVG